jgi:hypothetical protein
MSLRLFLTKLRTVQSTHLTQKRLLRYRFTYFHVHVYFSFETIHYLHTLSYKYCQSHANNRLEDEPFDEVNLHDSIHFL